MENQTKNRFKRGLLCILGNGPKDDFSSKGGLPSYLRLNWRGGIILATVPRWYNRAAAALRALSRCSACCTAACMLGWFLLLGRLATGLHRLGCIGWAAYLALLFFFSLSLLSLFLFL